MTSLRIALVATALYIVTTGPAAVAQNGGEHWVGTWGTAVVPRPQAAPGAAPGRGAVPLNFNNQTLRQVVHVSLGGSRLRVVLSNAFGTSPLAVGAASVALRQKDSMIVAGSNRPLTFSGSATPVIAAGAVAVSDPVSLTVPALADLAIDVFLPGDTAASTSPLTTHNGALQTNYLSAAGNHVGAAEFPVSATTQSWFFLSAVDVSAPAQVGAVVALGDSLTDGTLSTPDSNNRWPDHLARRLMPSGRGKGARPMGVLNEGIAGNRVLSEVVGPSALARFDRDVLAQSGVTHIIMLVGINDLGLGGNGLFPGREGDEFGIAYAYTDLSDVLKDNLDLLPLGGRLRVEHQLEMFYILHLAPWLQITADLQVIRPTRPVADTAIIPAARLRVVF